MISSPLTEQLPVNEGVALSVTLSVLLMPVSLAAVRSGVPGVLEAAVSTVIDKLGLAEL